MGIVGVIVIGLFAAIILKLLSTGLVSTLLYIALSYYGNFDTEYPLLTNYDGEVEDNQYTHRFVHLNQTYSGRPVNVTYHIVECGAPDAEPIVFGHGLCENWRVWKHIMKEFCDTHRVIAYDSEGMGQSEWPDVLRDLPNGQSRYFMADMQKEMLRQINVHRFNLVVTDYSFWSTLSMIDEFGDDPILRYGKLQSTVGVEDIDRIPQGKMIKIFPQTMDWLFNLNRAALARVLYSRPLITWLPNLKENGRNVVEISEKDFQEIILTGLREKGLTAWIYFYNYGPDLTNQMTNQINTFRKARYPVLMMQGKADKGQPFDLFDGTVRLEIVEGAPKGTMEHLLRVNLTHKTRAIYSKDKTQIGPKAEDFFENSPWVKMVPLDVGHFLHLEAPDQLIAQLKELFAVPLLSDREFKYSPPDAARD